jgi:hypothetical protein
MTVYIVIASKKARRIAAATHTPYVVRHFGAKNWRKYEN